MFNSIIEFIQNSVAAVVTLTVGVLGIGSDNVLSTQTANIADAVSPVVVEEVVTPVTEEEVVTPVVEEVVVPESNLSLVSPHAPKTKYFERINISPAIFSRPTSDSEVLLPNNNIITLAVDDSQDIPLVGNLTDFTEPVEEKKEIDTSFLLNVNFDNIDPNLQIIKITEDNDRFYGLYQFKSLGIRDYKWQEVTKEKQISLAKSVLGNKNLNEYFLEELGEVVGNEMAFLREVQNIQKEKLAISSGVEKPVTDTVSTLIGRILDTDINQINDVTQVVTIVEEDEEPVVVEGTEGSDNEAPLVIIKGNNPALIQIGSSYMDLGAQVTDNMSNNLGVVVGGDVVDTNVSGSYFVTYTATDGDGNVATATREVIVYDYGDAPIVVEEEEEVVTPVAEEEVVTPVVEEVVTPVAEEEVVVPVVEEVVTPVAEEEVVVPVVEEVVTPVAEEEVVTPVVEEVVTPVAEEEVVTPVVEEVVVPVAEEEVVTPVAEEEVVVPVVEEVGKGNNNKGIKKVVEVVSETTSAVAEVVLDTTTATIEQVSSAIETVAEEVSAMIKAVRFMELIGNIRAALQASVSTAGEGTGSFVKTASKGVVEIVDWVVGGVYSVWQSFGLDKTVSEASNSVTAKVSDYNKQIAPVGEVVKEVR